MKILICDYDEVMDRDLELEKGFLRAGLGDDIEIECYVYNGDDKEFFEKLSNTDVLMTAYLTINDRVLDNAPKLKMISVEANGYNSIDIQACKDRGIAIAFIEEYCTDEVADHTLTLALCAIRKINEYQNDMREKGIFRFNNRDGLFRISGKTWGIVGMGKIGRAAAKRAQAFGAKVIAYDPFADKNMAKQLDIELVGKEELFNQSHIISLHAAHTKETHHLICKESIEIMQNTPIIVNVSRGGLVCEKDLLEALDCGKVKGVGLDVFENEETENLKKSEFLTRKEVVITPHIAFYSDDSIKECARVVSQNIVHYIKGEYNKVTRMLYNPNEI